MVFFVIIELLSLKTLKNILFSQRKSVKILKMYIFKNVTFTNSSMLEADFAVAAVLISFGAVLGCASPVQLIVMALFEVVAYNLSIYVGIGQLEVSNCSNILLAKNT